MDELRKFRISSYIRENKKKSSTRRELQHRPSQRAKVTQRTHFCHRRALPFFFAAPLIAPLSSLHLTSKLFSRSGSDGSWWSFTFFFNEMLLLLRGLIGSICICRYTNCSFTSFAPHWFEITVQHQPKSNKYSKPDDDQREWRYSKGSTKSQPQWKMKHFSLSSQLPMWIFSVSWRF